MCSGGEAGGPAATSGIKPGYEPAAEAPGSAATGTSDVGLMAALQLASPHTSTNEQAAFRRVRCCACRCSGRIMKLKRGAPWVSAPPENENSGRKDSGCCSQPHGGNMVALTLHSGVNVISLASGLGGLRGRNHLRALTWWDWCGSGDQAPVLVNGNVLRCHVPTLRFAVAYAGWNDVGFLVAMASYVHGPTVRPNVYRRECTVTICVANKGAPLSSRRNSVRRSHSPRHAQTYQPKNNHLP